MKESPQDKKLNDILRSSRLAAGGFMGDDPRSVFDVIDADAGILDELDVTKEQLAQRMRHITDVAKTSLGTWVLIDENIEAEIMEVCKTEALEQGKKIKEIDTAGKSSEETAEEIHKALI